jgi:hypothetical protein
VRFLSYLVKSKRNALAWGVAALAAGGAYSVLTKLRLQEEIGWIETGLFTALAFVVTRRLVRFVFDRTLRGAFKRARKSLARFRAKR